jgi:MraZ protein
MPVFAGHYERSIDAKGRIQLPAPLRAAIDKDRDGAGLYVQLGVHPRTLALYTERGFDQLAERMKTEYMTGADSRRFELQFYGLASFVELDNQGRFVIPDRLRRKARLGEEVYLVGQKHRIDIWSRADYETAMGIDWEGDDWPNWDGFLHMRPSEPK